MLSFKEFVAENSTVTEGKLYATTKDGIRKPAKNDQHASEIRASYHNPKKDPAYKAPPSVKLARHELRKADSVNHERIAMHAASAVADHFPDTDGYDQVRSRVNKSYPHLNDDQVTHHINKAVKKHLGAKHYDDYVEQVHKEFHQTAGPTPGSGNY